MKVWCLFCLVPLLAAPASGQNAQGDDAQKCSQNGIAADEAMQFCTRAIDSGQLPAIDLAITYYNRGATWAAKGEYDKAIADYSETIRLNPNYSAAYGNRGVLWAAKGDYGKAIADYNDAIRLNPNSADVYNSRCAAWKNRGDFDRAIADCDRAVQLDPNGPDAWNNRGAAWRGKGEYAKAIADYTEAIRLDPKDAQAWNNRGNAWLSQGENAKAIADYSEAIRLDPNNAGAWRSRGVAEFGRQDWAAAAVDFARVHELNGKDAYAELWLAAAGMRQGAGDWAARLKEQAGSLGAGWPRPLAEFYSGALAAEQLQAAANDPDPIRQRGQLCDIAFFLGEWQLGHDQRQAAIENLRQAESICAKASYQHRGAVDALKNVEAAGAAPGANP